MRRTLMAFALAVGFSVSGMVVTPAIASETACAQHPTIHPALTFNPCAILDNSQIAVSRNGKTYSYCWTDWKFWWCKEESRWEKVPIWQEYQVGHRPSGCHVGLSALPR